MTQEQPKTTNTVKIVTLSAVQTGFNPNGTPNMTVFGLGDNNRVYIWSYQLGMWVQNWEVAKPIANDRNAKRVAKKNMKKKR